MRKLILIFIICVSSLSYLKAQTNSEFHTTEQKNQAMALAKKWVDQFIKGKDIDYLMSVSTVPFAMDRKTILNSEEKLKAFYQEIIDDKGKRDEMEFATEIYKSKYEIIDKCIPINVLIVKVNITAGALLGQQILVSVQLAGKKQRVVGFTD